MANEEQLRNPSINWASILPKATTCNSHHHESWIHFNNYALGRKHIEIDIDLVMW